MTLSPKDAKKARVFELLSQGISKNQIADIVGVSDRTIRRWVSENQNISQVKKDTLNQIVQVESPGQNVHEHCSEISLTSEINSKEEYLKKLEEYRGINMRIANTLMDIGFNVLNLVKSSAENFSEKQIDSIKKLELAYKVGSHASNLGSSLMSETLAIDELHQKIDELMGD